MGVIDIGISDTSRPCSIRLDLDMARSNENTVLQYIGSGRLYEPEVARVLLRVLREGDTFIDVGANLGFFTVLAGALVGPTGRVLCFEPDPDNNTRLRNNVGLNGFQNVSIVDQPAMSEAAGMNFYANPTDSGWSAAWPSGLPRETPDVLVLDSTTLDAEVARHQLSNVRLVKIDTEGADHDVVRGAAALFADNAVPFVVCELNDFALAKMGSSQAAFRACMAERGYDCFMLFYDGRLPYLVPPGTNIRQKCVGNIMFSTCAMVGSCWDDCLYDAGLL